MEHKLKYQSTKTFDHNVGLSCAFRQWKAIDSHCSKLHGYAISVKLIFESAELDEKNWVVDFGGLKEIKYWLETQFDHKTLIAIDDPHFDWFIEAEKRGIVDLNILEKVGCEAFAKYIYKTVFDWLSVTHGDRVTLKSVEVREHSGNSALVYAQ